MRKLFAFLALGTILVVVAATAQAQRFGGGGGFQQSGYQLLSNKSVQDELKLTEEQKTKVKEVADKIRADAKEGGAKGGFGGLSKDSTKEEIEKAMAKFAEAAKATNEKAMKELTPVLKEEQLKRLKQIERQQLRMGVFADAEFAKEIGITDEQKEKIKAIADETGKDSREIQMAIRNKEMDQKDGTKKIEAIRKDGADKVMEILKDDQKSKYKAALGEPFEVRFEFGGGGNFGKGKDKSKDKDK